MSNDTPQYQPGDIVNGHQLVEQKNGTLEWVPVPIQAPATDTGLPAAKPKRKWYTRKRIIIPAAVLLLIIIIGSINRPSANDTAADKGLEVVQTEPKKDEPEEPAEPAKLAVPDVTGMAASTAVSTLRAAGFDVADPADPAAIVTATTPAKGGIAEKGSAVTLAVEPPKPQLTLSQQNAVQQAESYLRYQSFSRSGLIGQLEYEGYSTEDATFATDYVGADWGAQAVAKAQSYLKYQSFSREGLYDQLIYEGFSDAEANHGLAGVGY